MMRGVNAPLLATVLALLLLTRIVTVGTTYDDEIGLYYLQSRYYDSNVSRFINVDDSNILQSLYNVKYENLFSYSLNDPIDLSDNL